MKTYREYIKYYGLGWLLITGFLSVLYALKQAMKKIITTLMFAFIVSAAFAQTTTPKPVKASKSVKFPHPAADSLIYKLSDKDLALRVSSTNNLLYILKSGTGDITPNQLRGAVALADSLQKVDQTWYNKFHPVKKQ